MKVPFIDLNYQNSLVANGLDWVSGAISQMEFIAGESGKQLETEIAAHVNYPGEFIACANGTDALELAIIASFGIGTNKKIACPDLTFWASCEAIVTSGHLPVFVDVDGQDYNLSYRSLVEVHEEVELDGLILPHLFGWASKELSKIREFCRSENIQLIEDAAQAFGVKIGGKSIFENADLATLSFYPAKVLGGCMDGGGVFCKDPALAKDIRSLMNHGRDSHYGYRQVGRNSRMSGVQARYLTLMLRHIDQIVTDRLTAQKRYTENLSAATKLTVLEPPEGVNGNGYLQVSLCEDPIQLQHKLGEHGIGTGRVYPSRMSEQKAEFQFLKPFETESAKRFCQSVINLPLFSGISPQQINHCTEIVCKELNA